VSQSVLLIAGEVSGDMHAAALVRAVRARRPDVEFYGIGGEQLRAAGMETLYDVREMAVMGLNEVLRRYRFFKRVFKEMLELAELRQPNLVLLVDYPGFNLRFARQMSKRGLRTIYYICPQVWAWHRARIPRMAEMLRRLIVIFPFEVEVFSGTSLRVDFVGHPLVDEARRELAAPVRELPWPAARRVALLPGSREHEVRRILPTLWAAAAELERQYPDAGFLLAAPSAEVAALIEAVLKKCGPGPRHFGIVTGATRAVLRQARAALVTSGTATVETALMGCPMVVVYRTAWLTYALGRMLIRVPHIGMVNIVAGRGLCPEFIQGAARPAALAAALAPLLEETPERAAMVAGLAEVAAALGSGGAAERAATIVLEELDRPTVAEIMARVQSAQAAAGGPGPAARRPREQ